VENEIALLFISFFVVVENRYLCCQKTKCNSFVNKFKFWRGGEGGEGEGGVRGVEKKEEEELKEQIDVKVSTKFQINPSTDGWEKSTQSDMGTDISLSSEETEEEKEED
jgi:hypothetical protein